MQVEDLAERLSSKDSIRRLGILPTWVSDKRGPESQASSCGRSCLKSLRLIVLANVGVVTLIRSVSGGAFSAACVYTKHRPMGTIGTILIVLLVLALLGGGISLGR